MLPDSFLADLRQRVSLAEVVGRDVAEWDKSRTRPSRREYWCLCPFHEEKTASFKIDDGKGRYHCFGCQAAGDVIAYVMATANLPFPEAVERLARDAGMEMPGQHPPRRRDRQREASMAALSAAADWYRRQLHGRHGGGARAYLASRGLDAGAVERFGIGYAPAAGGVLAALAANGFEEAALVAAGLAAKAAAGAPQRDRFRDRIMFPIEDERGQCIAFGGRAMNPEARAKYLNSPATPVFDKGRTLYNYGPGRAAAGKNGELVVVEGFLDVIALVQGGLEHVVSPLGTALTEDHLRTLWRGCPEPVLLLDGDEAGRRAAARALDRALPLLETGRSLRFATLPSGHDPDSLARKSGIAALRECLDASRPAIDLLWSAATAGRMIDGPDRSAALAAELMRSVGAIPDAGLRGHYQAMLGVRFREKFGYAPPAADRQDSGGERRGWLPLYTALRRAPGQRRRCGTVFLTYGAAGRVAGMTVAHDWLPGAVLRVEMNPVT